MEQEKLAKLAESKRTRIRAMMQAWREHLATQGRKYDKLDVSIYAVYGGEAVMRAIASGPYGDTTVLKGGSLFRLWEGPSSRPTMDLDLQAVDPTVPSEQVRDWLMEALLDPEFTASTGIVVKPGDLKVTSIKDGILPGAWRIQGDVTLGPPIADSTRIHLCIETTWGYAPTAAYGKSTVPALLPKEESFSMMTAHREWMLAEKLHSLISRGSDNTRLKDFFDLATKLLPHPSLDLDRIGVCLQHVFTKEFQDQHKMPATADGAVALTAAYGEKNGQEMAKQWEKRKWAEFEGRSFDPKRDPTVGEACEAIAYHLERLGFLAPCPTAEASAAHRALVTAAGQFAKGSKDAGTAACSALGTLVRLADKLDSARLVARINAENWALGAGKPVASADFAAAVKILADDGVISEVALNVDGALGHPLEAELAKLQSMLKADQPVAAVTKPNEKKASGKREMTPERIQQAIKNVANPALNTWLVGVATLAEAVQGGYDLTGVEFSIVEPNGGFDKAAKPWASIASKNGFVEDVRTVISEIEAANTPTRRM
jgi:hypothetical protein